MIIIIIKIIIKNVFDAVAYIITKFYEPFKFFDLSIIRRFAMSKKRFNVSKSV